jgi:uncharacterized protein
MSVSVERVRTAADFLAAAEPWLLEAEADNNLLLSTALVLATDDHPFRDPVYYAIVRNARGIVGCALAPPPDGLDVGALPPAAAALLVDSVREVRPDLPNVNGHPAAALAFAEAWARERGGDFRYQYRGRLFGLASLRRPPLPRGRLRLAADGDAELVAAWAKRYALAIDTHVDLTALFARMQRRRSLFVWDDRGAKCMVGESGATPRGTRINAVYTPDEFRGRGYASAAVAVVAERALAGGCEHCVLLAEPGPDRIYERLGFRAIREHVLLELRPAG